MNLETKGACVGFALLAVLAAKDIESRSLPGNLLSIYLITALTIGTQACKSPQDLAVRAVTGLLLLAVSAISKGGIGRGDGYVVLAQGFILGVRKVVNELLLGLVLSSVFGLALIALGKGTTKTRLPLAAFLALAEAIRLIAEGG